MGVLPGRKIANSSPPMRPTRSGFAQHAADRGGDDLQRLVAAIVPKTVVDRLEIVRVDHEQGAARVAPGRRHLVEIALDHRGEGRPVEHRGQLVGGGIAPQLVMRDGELAQLVHQEIADRHGEDGGQQEVDQDGPETAGLVQRIEIEGVDEECRGDAERGDAERRQVNPAHTAGREIHSVRLSCETRRPTKQRQLNTPLIPMVTIYRWSRNPPAG